jgi:hypothetical protein
MNHDRIVPLTVERRVAVIPVYSDNGGCSALVDAEDGVSVSTFAWFRHRRTGYPTYRRSNGFMLTLHAWLLGAPPKGMVFDHANGNKLDNRRSNLRLLTVAQNGLNRHRANRNNKSSGTPGVCWSKAEQKWRVQIRRNGKDHFGGYFADEAQAKEAATRLRSKLLEKQEAPQNS